MKIVRTGSFADTATASDEHEQRLERHLQAAPALVMAAGLYLVAYELLKSGVVDQVRGFYSFTFSGDQGWITGPEYEEAVRGRAKHGARRLPPLVDRSPRSDARAGRRSRPGSGDPQQRGARPVSLPRRSRPDVRLAGTRGRSGGAATSGRLFRHSRSRPRPGAVRRRRRGLDQIENGVSLLYGHLLSQVVAVRQAIEYDCEMGDGCDG